MNKHCVSVVYAVLGASAFAFEKPPALCPDGSTILFQGDSLTGGRHWNDMNHVYGHTYVWEVASRYQALAPERRLQFANCGKGGDTSADFVSRWSKDAFPYTIGENGYEGAFGRKKGETVVPDCVSSLIGINGCQEADIPVFAIIRVCRGA